MSKNNNHEENIDEIINSAMQNLKEVVDSNTIIGKPIKASRDVTVLTVTKINVGFVAGGGQLNSKIKSQKQLPFSGGSGAGFNVTPVGLITISRGEVKFVPIEQINATSELVTLTNKIFSKVMDSFKGGNDDDVN